MSTRAQITALAAALLLTFAACSVAPAAKRIEWWKHSAPEKPAGEKATAPEETESGEPATEEETGEEPEENRPVDILTAAAERTGMPLAGEVKGATGEQLQPPEATEGVEAPVDVGGPPPLSDFAVRERFGDYRLVAAATADYTHPKGPTLHASLFELETSDDAWGLWSRDRGEKTVRVGQAAAFGPELRVWKGNFTAVLSMDPPDERWDETRLTQFARGLFGLVTGTGREPTMVGWLPTGLQLSHTLVYFHADPPVGGASMNLSEETQGVIVEYQVGEDPQPFYGGLVSYPDREAALEGWDEFVGVQLALDPESGTRGDRRTNIQGGRWSGVKMNGQVCAFVMRAPTRNYAERFLAQAAGHASSGGVASPRPGAAGPGPVYVEP